MPVLNDEYLPFPVTDKDGRLLEMVYRTHIWFMFKIGHRLTRPIAGLIDSGADRNLFPAQIGEHLGINVKRGKKHITTGIGSHQIITFRHSGIDLLFDSGHHFETEVDSSYEIETLLLGGIGFFDKFKKVILQKKEEVVKLEY